jgi:Rps23 Pro-64 3,4-dihydroxylase Tpa1-like proline 4-hydroxylase
MNDLCPDHLRHDPKFHAGGLHAMPPGGWLDLHLDAECHPTTGDKRHTNAVLFLDDADSGALELWNSEATRCEVSILPAAGRCVVFECQNVVHGIPTPINPFGGWRRSLACFWYDPSPERRRAQFLKMPGERFDPVKDQWRRERAKA